MRVAVFRSDLAAPSEGYIQEQAEAMDTEYRLFGFRQFDSSAQCLPISRAAAVENLTFRAAAKAPLMARRITKYNPDAILCHFGWDGIRLLRCLPRKHAPVAVYLHGSDAMTDWTRVDGWQARMMRRQWPVLSRADRIICSSHAVAEATVSKGTPEQIVSVARVGASPSKFGKGSVCTREHRVLAVGRLVPSKGFDHLIRAMAAISDGHRPRLEIVGAGPEEERLRRLVTAVGLDGEVTFHGAMQRDDVRFLMRTSLLVAVPSVALPDGASEGFGLVALEAQLESTYVIGSSVGGLPEAAAPGCSTLVPPGDYRALAEAILAAAVNPHETERRGALACEWAQQMSFCKTGAHLRKILEEMV